MTLATGVHGQLAVTSVHDGHLYEAPMSDFLSLSHASPCRI